MEKGKLTEADKYALERCPTGVWFEPYDLPATICRPRYRCDRLVAHSLLVHRVRNTTRGLHISEYRIRECK